MTQSYPSYPQGGDRNQHSHFPVERGPAPPSVRAAVWLMLLRCVFGVASIIVLLATKDTIKRRIEKDNPDYSTHRIDTALNAILAVGIVIAVVFLVLYVLLAWQVSKGKQWARIVTWVFGGLGIISALASFGEDESGASHALSAVVGVIDISIVVLLIVGGKGGFFRSPAADQHYDSAYPPPPYPAPPA